MSAEFVIPDWMAPAEPPPQPTLRLQAQRVSPRDPHACDNRSADLFELPMR
jgi:hypothetical protein